MIELVEGKFYWVLTDTHHSLCLDIHHYFNDLKYLELSHTTHRMDDGKKWYFKNFEDGEDPYVVIDEWGIEQWIFKSQDDFLKYLTVHVDNLNSMRDSEEQPMYYFDDELKQKIKESQEENPEAWI
jgi:hypothetical protein